MRQQTFIQYTIEATRGSSCSNISVYNVASMLGGTSEAQPSMSRAAAPPPPKQTDQGPTSSEAAVNLHLFYGRGPGKEMLEGEEAVAAAAEAAAFDAAGSWSSQASEGRGDTGLSPLKGYGEAPTVPHGGEQYWRATCLGLTEIIRARP